MHNNKLSTDKETLNQVYEAAKEEGASFISCATKIRNLALDWRDETFMRLVAHEWRIGRMTGSLGLGSREEAEAVAKAGSKRTALQQRAYRAAVSAWSTVMLVAGAPNRRTGEKRAVRTIDTKSKVVAAKAAANENRPSALFEGKNLQSPRVRAIIAQAVPRVRNVVEVATFAQRLCDIIAAFERHNAEGSLGDYREVFDTFVHSVKALNAKIARAA